MYCATRSSALSFFRLAIGALFHLRARAAPASLSPDAAIPFSPGFDISKVLSLAQSLPSHSWEFGTASEALLELYEPSVSVFGDVPFPPPTLTTENSKSLAYASTKFQLESGSPALVPGDGASGDPASLGISAYLLGKTDPELAAAATTQLDYLLDTVPRFWNGAISQRDDYAELW